MDGQQAGIDAEHVVTRPIAPVRRFSAFKPNLLTYVALSSTLFAFAYSVGISFAPRRDIPVVLLFLGSFGIGSTIFFNGRVHVAVTARAWRPFRARCAAEAEQALRSLAVQPLLRWDVDAGRAAASNDCWPTGVGWDGKFLYVVDRGLGARIPLAAVREWTWVADQAGTTGWHAVGSAMHVQMARNQALARDDRDARVVVTGNGLHLTVREIDRPTWQYQTSDEATLRRWAELLNQAVEKAAA